MIAIVPAKSNSKRIPNKNWREFYDGKSLVDITIAKLRSVLPGDRIYLSCDDPARNSDANRLGVQFLPREHRLTLNETPLTQLIRSVCRQATKDDDVLWAQVINPLFDHFDEAIERWREVSACHDSLCVLYRRHSYLLDAAKRPIGWGFGENHVPSQRLPFHFEMTFTCSVLSQESINATGYYIGEKPYWYELDEPFVDIDTIEDFETARSLYAIRADAGSSRLTV